MDDNDSLEDYRSTMNNCSIDDNNQNIVQSSPVQFDTSPKPELDLQVDSEMELYDRIASKLLRSKFLLTALELHAELIERGKESTKLRDFFDNPHNFEKHFEISPITNKLTSELSSKNLERSPSEKTFDSLDFTHYSDDDIERHGDERIAVLEFELRKAQQTINSLRASLTMSTTGHCSDIINVGHLEAQELIMKNNLNDTNQFSETYSLRDLYCRGSADGDSCPGEDDKFSKITNLSESDKLEPGYQNTEKYSIASLIKPHEKRAINYLINEYLMANNYKLTSITFCDENTDQDFDNWEDVGLNIARPPDLLKLYRNFWKNRSTNLMRTNSNATTIVSHRTITNDLETND